MNQQKDEELVKLAKQGNETALDILLSRYKNMAQKIARSYFLIGAEYEDLLQEAMIGLIKAFRNYDSSQSSFSTFARLCIERSVVDAVKTANRKKNTILSNSLSLSNQGTVTVFNEDILEPVNIVIPSTDPLPEEELIKEEMFQQIKDKIKTALSPFEQKVLMLFLRGDSYQQIAHTLHSTEKSVDNALSRIKTKAKQF